MGIFDKIFGSNDEQKKEVKSIPWLRLTRIEDLDRLHQESFNNRVVIFKHSTRCGISRMVLREFEKSFDVSQENIKLYFLDLLSFREVSNEVAIRFQVLHQSPQLIVLRNGITVHHSSHYSIDAGVLQNN